MFSEEERWCEPLDCPWCGKEAGNIEQKTISPPLLKCCQDEWLSAPIWNRAVRRELARLRGVQFGEEFLALTGAPHSLSASEATQVIQTGGLI